MQFKTPLILTTVSALALAGCTDTFNGGQRTEAGAATGAIVGGLYGLTRDGDNKVLKGAVGAAIGAAAGGAIGNALDRQAGDLRDSMGNDDVDIVNTGSELIVTMPQDILFATDSSTVSAGLYGDLAALAQNLQQYPDSTVDVIGHTDNVGDAGYNQELSARRATAVASILTNNGVQPGRVRAYGRGEDAPIASNLTPEGRQQNRRVEIVIRPTA
ncbi:OmpA family protein [Aliiroseovarius sp. PTFE2010]|uniref:OmpA family protein n=1 Tax=Aliiroseovarius sp. PTFE2010 TaxID=3417190 RepID=UPI003CF87D20